MRYSIDEIDKDDSRNINSGRQVVAFGRVVIFTGRCYKPVFNSVTVTKVNLWICLIFIDGCDPSNFFSLTDGRISNVYL